MRKLVVILLTFICFATYSQPEWELIHGSDSTANIGNVFTTDANHTWGSSGGAIYFSPDGGQSWNQQYYHDDYYYADIFFTDSLTGWLVGWQEVMKTADGGLTWTLQDLPNPNGMDVEAVFFINPDTGWISASYKMIYVTYDGGENWIVQHNTVYSGHYFLYDIYFWDSLHGCAVGGMLLNPNSPIIMTTNDGGVNWTEIYDIGDNEFKKVQFTNDSTVWAVNFYGALFRSNDGGFTWEFKESWPHFYPGDMHFFNNDSAIIMDYITMYRTQNSWIDYDHTDYAMCNFLSNFSFLDDATGIAVGSNNILVTSDAGYSWKRLNGRYNRIGFFDEENGWIIQEHLNRNLMHSNDGGYNWTELETGHSGSLLELSFPTPSTGFVISDKMELLKTTDAGNNWELMNLTTDSSYIMEMQFVNQDTGFMCGYTDRFYRTYDGGLNWDSFQIDNTFYISDLFFINGHEGWIIIRDGILGHTLNGGDSWDFTRTPTYNLAFVYFINRQKGFIYSEIGDLYMTVDSGKTWNANSQKFTHPANLEFTDSLSGWMTDKNKVYRTLDGGLTWELYFEPVSKNYSKQNTDLSMLDSAHAWFVQWTEGYIHFQLSLGQRSSKNRD